MPVEITSTFLWHRVLRFSLAIKPFKGVLQHLLRVAWNAASRLWGLLWTCQPNNIASGILESPQALKHSWKAPAPFSVNHVTGRVWTTWVVKKLPWLICGHSRHERHGTPPRPRSDSCGSHVVISEAHMRLKEEKVLKVMMCAGVVSYHFFIPFM